MLSPKLFIIHLNLACLYQSEYKLKSGITRAEEIVMSPCEPEFNSIKSIRLPTVFCGFEPHLCIHIKVSKGREEQ
jgi:hypothetical protein